MDFDQLPHHWVNRLSFVLRKQLTQDFQDQGEDISAEEWAVLLILSKHTEITATVLSNMTFRDKTTVTRMVDKLVKKGLVDRIPDRQDRRVVHLKMTAMGNATFQRLADIAQTLIHRTTDGLAASDIEITVKTLSAMVDNLTTPKREEISHDL